MPPKADDVSLARPPALRRAVEFGVDLTLLIENLKHSPTERVRRAQRSLDSLLALAAAAAAWRQRRKPRS